jgi:hypothetical protein
MSDFFDSTFADTNEENDAFEEFSAELRDIINEMGYNVEEEELHEIEKGKNQKLLQQINPNSLRSSFVGRKCGRCRPPIIFLPNGSSRRLFH